MTHTERARHIIVGLKLPNELIPALAEEFAVVERLAAARALRDAAGWVVAQLRAELDSRIAAYAKLVLDLKEAQEAQEALDAPGPDPLAALRVAEAALVRYVTAQSRMRDDWSEGDAAMKHQLWVDLHACEENGRDALATVRAALGPSSGTGSDA